ncbi:hypothetical protein DL764_001899 [Monosporascus ibericus]|uniref:DUF7888 domain-containing protein n=1 Tax=Monosporascus ibericus TaxID=155417 RepID=A0A4Q4TSK0_9PEZI|nr:hypothetical protein DL764_001899 [Monosporascus ibericus]
MQFSTVFNLALFASMAMATPMPAPAVGDPNANIPKSVTVNLTGQKKGDKFIEGLEPTGNVARDLNERVVGATVTVLAIVATPAIAKIAQIAIQIGADTIKNLGKWNEAREKFTQATTNAMWDRNPDYNRFPAVACYNKGYSLKDPNNIDGLVSAKFELGLLSTDFDCMYVGAPNQFYTHSEGGYINLSYTYNPARCSFDQNTGDLTCN